MLLDWNFTQHCWLSHPHSAHLYNTEPQSRKAWQFTCAGLPCSLLASFVTSPCGSPTSCFRVNRLCAKITKICEYTLEACVAILQKNAIKLLPILCLGSIPASRSTQRAALNSRAPNANLCYSFLLHLVCPDGIFTSLQLASQRSRIGLGVYQNAKRHVAITC